MKPSAVPVQRIFAEHGGCSTRLRGAQPSPHELPSAPGHCRCEQNNALMYRNAVPERGCRRVRPCTVGIQGCLGAAEDICDTFRIWPEGPGGSSDIPGQPQLRHVLLTTVYLLMLMVWVRSASRTGGTGRINTLLVGVLILLQVNSVEKLSICLPVGGTRRIPSPQQAIPRLAVSNSLPAPV